MAKQVPSIWRNNKVKSVGKLKKRKVSKTFCNIFSPQKKSPASYPKIIKIDVWCSGYRRTVEVERTEAQHKQWQESQSQGLQAQSSCQNNQEKTDNKQLSEMVIILSTSTSTSTSTHQPLPHFQVPINPFSNPISVLQMRHKKTKIEKSSEFLLFNFQLILN